MKTTIEIPDDVFRQAKATAALRGETLRDFVTAALCARLAQQAAAEPSGWRSVFGQASRAEVEEVDAIVAADLEQIDPSEWR